MTYISFEMPANCPACGKPIEGVAGQGTAHIYPNYGRLQAPARPCGHLVEMNPTSTQPTYPVPTDTLNMVRHTDLPYPPGETLQERIDRRRRELGNYDPRPYAVSIDGGPLVYGELTMFTEGRFGTYEWRIETEQPIERDQLMAAVRPLEVVTVRFGNTDQQPYEGRAHATSTDIDAFTGTHTTTYQGTGELTCHG